MKKLLAILLASAMVIGLVACASQPAATEAPATEAATEAAATTAASTTAAATTAAAAEAATEAPATEAAAAEDDWLPLVKDGEKKTVTIGIKADANTEDYETNEFTKYIEEKTGIDLEFVMFSSDMEEAKQQFALMVAAGEKLPDMLYGFQTDSAWGFDYGEQGYFIDLTDYFENSTHFWKEFWESGCLSDVDKKEYMSLITDPVTNEKYCFPTQSVPSAISTDMLNPVWLINQQWLDKLGLAYPTTVDELHDVLTHFLNDDPNGNGQKDEIPFFTTENPWHGGGLQSIINAYIYCQDEYTFNVEDGKVYVPYDQDEYRQALITLNQWYKEGLISPMSFSIQEYAELSSLFNVADGETAIIGSSSGHTTLYTEKDNWILQQYVGMTPLKGETERGGFASLYGTTYYFSNYITCDAEDPELVFKLMDFFSEEGAFMFSRYGREGIDWEYCDPNAGLTNAAGLPAVVTIIDSSPYSTQNNINWHSVQGCCQRYRWMPTSFVDTGSWANLRTKLTAEAVKATLEVPQPAEYIMNMSFSNEDQEIVTEYKAQFMDYVKEARAQFVTGVLDPNDDSAWETYKAALENLGMSKLIQCAQNSYDR